MYFPAMAIEQEIREILKNTTRPAIIILSSPSKNNDFVNINNIGKDAARKYDSLLLNIRPPISGNNVMPSSSLIEARVSIVFVFSTELSASTIILGISNSIKNIEFLIFIFVHLMFESWGELGVQRLRQSHTNDLLELILLTI